MKTTKWTEVTIRTAPPYQELLSGALANLGFEGFLQDDARLVCYISFDRWKKEVESTFTLLLRNFRQEFSGLSLEWDTSTTHEKNWNEVWERSSGIVDATSSIVIKPSWKKLRKRDLGKTVLHIDPKMAFGTGHHETTRLALVLLEQYVEPGCAVLDFGTGTGVVAIAAVKLGAHSALAIDIDKWAVENARENVARNRVNRRVKVLLGDGTRLPKRSFGLIISNIDLPTIIKSLKLLVKRLMPGGTLILSGILTAELSAFMDAISHQGLLPLELIGENEWSALALTKAHAHRSN